MVAAMAIRNLDNVDAVIDAVGGTAAAARLTSKKLQHISNWRSEGRIAHSTFLLFKDELRKRRLKAPPALWGITQPKKKRKAKIAS